MKQEEVVYTGKYQSGASSVKTTHDDANIKAGQASMIVGDYSGETYNQVYAEYMTSGDSQSLSGAKAQVDVEVQPQIVEGIIKGSESPDFASRAIQLYMSQPESPTGVVAKEATSANDRATLYFNEQVAYEQAKYNLRKALSQDVDELTAKDTVAEVAQLVFIPYLEQMKAIGVEPEGFEGSIFHGSNLELLHKEFAKMTTQDKIQYLNGLYERIKDTPIKNSLTELFTIDAIIEGQADWEKWLNNFITVMDTTVVAGAAIKSVAKVSGTAKGLMKTPSEESPVELLAQSNPELAQQLTEAGISNEAVADIVSGTTSKGLYSETHMPHSTLDEVPLKGMSSGLSMAEKRRRATQESIYDSASGTGFRLSDEQRLEKIQKAKLEADDIAILYGDMRVEAKVAEDGEYMALSIPIARETDSGVVPFTSPIDAINTALKTGEKYGVTEDNIQLYVRDMRTKEFSAVSGDELKTLLEANQVGEYTTVINTLQRFDTKGSISGEEMARFGSLQKALTINGKNFSNYILDPANQLGKMLTGALGVASDKTTSIQKKLVDMIDKDFASLKTSSKKNVWDVIEKGNDGRRYFTEAELKAGKSSDGKYTFTPLNDKEVNATYSVYRFWDTVWQLDNRTFNRKLIDEGFYRLSAKNGEEVMFAKPVGIDSVSGKVFNPDTGELLSSRDAMNLAKEQNLQLYKLKYNRDGADYVIRTANTSGRRVRENDVSLRKIDGYVKRNYTADYFVEKVNRSTGQVVKVVAAGSRLGDAQSYIARMGDDKDYIYQWRRAKEQSQVDGLRSDYEKGRSVERRRGEQLSSFVDLDREIGKGNIENPIESMINAAASTANASVMFDTIKTMKGNFMKKYGVGSFPRTTEEITDVRVNGVDKTAEAKAVHTYISNMENVGDNNLVSNVLRDVLFNMSEIIEEGKVLGKLSGVTGETLRSVGKVDPIRAARTLPHVLFIAAAPIRQLIIQHSQLLQVMPLTKRYANPFNLMKDMHIMRSLYATKDDISKFDKIINKQAKWLGMSPSELRSLFKAFDESGLAESVHSNTMIEKTFAMAGKDIYNSKVGHVAAKVGQVATVIPHYGQKYGFDVGEFNNLLGTFLVAYERRRGSVNLGSQTDRASLADDARKLSWNMNQAGKFGYQYGMLSIPMQFVQVPHKALLNMITGSGILTREERMRVAAMNLTLFGMAGFGIDSLLDSLKDEVSPEVHSALADGMLNRVLNSFGDFITGGDGSNVDWAGSFSPISAPQDIIGKPIEALLEGRIELGGAFFGAANKLFQTAQSTHDLFLLSNLDDNKFTPDEQLTYMLRNISTVYSGFNHFETFLLQQKTNRLMSLSGTDSGEATGLEIAAKLAGIRTIKETEMFDVINDTKALRRNYEESLRNAIKVSSKASLALDAFSANGQQAPEDLIMQLKLPADVAQLYSEADRIYGGKYFYNEWRRLNSNFEQDLSRFVHYTVQNTPAKELENEALANRYRRLLQMEGLTETEKTALNEMLGYLEGDK